MAKNKNIILYGIIAIAIIFILVLIFGFTSKTTTTTTTPGTTTTHEGLGGLLGDWKGWVKDFFGGSGGGTKKYCDCERPGYTMDGVQDSLCNSNGIQFESDCK